MKTFGLDLQKYEVEKEPPRLVSRDPADVMIPLKGGFGSALSPTVEVGDKVETGEIIARNDEKISTPVHASISGEVKGIEKIAYYHEETGEELGKGIEAVRIAGNPGDDAGGSGVEWEKEKPKNLRELFYLGGLTSFGQTGIPTEFNSSFYNPGDVEKILVNGAVTEPFVHHLVDYGEELSSFTTGLEIIARTFPNSRIHLVLDEETLSELNTLSSSQRIKVHSAKNEAEMARSKMLAREVLGAESLDEGGYLMDHGILALPEVFPLMAYRTVVEGVPFVRNRFGLGGSLAENLVVEAPIGTSLKEAVTGSLEESDRALTITGGPLSGNKLKDLGRPVGKDLRAIVQLEKPKETEFLSWLQTGLTKNSYTNAFFSALVPGKKKKADAGLHGEQRPCVYCGYCSDVCPVDILPYQIYQTHSHDMIDEVNRLQPQRCVDCGLCSYVCPSKLPLSSTVKEAKKAQPGDRNNYVEYEERDGSLVPVVTESDQGRGEDVE